MTKQVFTVREITELTGFHKDTVRKDIREGKLQATDTNPKRISRPELERWWKEEKGGGELFSTASTPTRP